MDPREASIELVARQRARHVITERSLRLSSARLHYVLPLLSFEKQNKPFVAACAIKVVIAGRRFLFTAAHVIDALNDGDLWYATSELKWSNITGESRHTDPPLGSQRDQDRLDAAVIELSQPSAPLIPGPYLSVRGMDINDVQAPGRKYIILGYPGTRTKKNFEERKVTPRALRYVGSPVSGDVYAKQGIARYSHLAMEFDRENVVDADGPTTAPHPAGMSGCGVWRFDSLSRPGLIERDKLVGIFIEYPSKADILVATRVSIHLEIVRHHWPELASDLPTARRVKVNIKANGDSSGGRTA